MLHFITLNDDDIVASHCIVQNYLRKGLRYLQLLQVENN